MATASSVGNKSCVWTHAGVGFGNPDLVQYARSFGAAGYRVTEPTELQSILREALQQHIPTLIACPIDCREDLRLTERLNRLAS